MDAAFLTEFAKVLYAAVAPLGMFWKAAAVLFMLVISYFAATSSDDMFAMVEKIDVSITPRGDSFVRTDGQQEVNLAKIDGALDKIDKALK